MAAIVLAACLLTGCGARTDLGLEMHQDGGTNVEAGAQPKDCLPSAVRGVVATGGDGVCVLEGRSADGRLHRMECRTNPEGCVWYTDGTERCRCDEPDWANTCGNGVPICAGWNLPFDFASDVTYE